MRPDRAGASSSRKEHAIAASKLTATLSVRIPDSWKEKLDKAAAKNGITVGEYTRDALAYYMASRNEWSIPGPRKEAT